MSFQFQEYPGRHVESWFCMLANICFKHKFIPEGSSGNLPIISNLDQSIEISVNHP